MTVTPPSNQDEASPLLVSFYGTRGSISTPGRGTEKYGGNTPCVYLRQDDVHIILDAGTGIRNLGLELLAEHAAQQTPMVLHLFLSHTHWDHIQGLPFFQPAYRDDVKLVIYGSPKKERFLEAVLRGQMDNDYFPVEMSAFAAHVHIREISEETIQLGRLRVAWEEQQFHPGGSVRYRFSYDNHRVVYATDVELDLMFADDATEEQAALGQQYLEFIRDADLLIADGQYTADEYASALGWGHTSIPTLLRIAHDAGVKEVAVFHHEPRHSDALLDAEWAEHGAPYISRRPQMNVFWAREGMTVAI